MAGLGLPAPPLITPAPTVPAFGAVDLRARAATSFSYSYNAACGGLGAFTSCSASIESCFGGLTALTSGYEAQFTSCFCNYGLPYLDCYFSAMSQEGCGDYVTDLNSYEMDWFTQECGSLPGSIQAKMTPPATVSLDFASVTIVHLNKTVPVTPHTSTPTYKGSGTLLAGACASTSYTLVDAGSTVFWAGFVGCNSDRPECCPWTVATNPIPLTVTADTTITVTSTVGGTAQPNLGQNTLGAYPVPQDSNQAVLQRCPDDHYSISGVCCPNGFWPFTRTVGGQTPCYSSLKTTDRAPTLTAGLAGQPTDTSKPTSAVVNIVWAMEYQVGGGGGGSGLSVGATAGIGVGAGVAGILILVLAFFLWRSRRKNKKTVAAAPVGPQPEMVHQVPAQGLEVGGPGGGAYPDLNKRASMITNSTSPPSMLVPQTTGTSAGAPTVSDISSSMQSGGGMYAAGVGAAAGAAAAAAAGHHQGYGPHGSSGAVSPANNGMGYPAPIAEADETQHQQQHAYYAPPPGQHMQPQGQMMAPPPLPPQGQPMPTSPPAQGGYFPPPGQQPGFGPPPQASPPPPGTFQQPPPGMVLWFDPNTQQHFFAPPQQPQPQQQPMYTQPSPPPMQQQQQQQQQQQYQGVPPAEMTGAREPVAPQEVAGSPLHSPPLMQGHPPAA